MARRFSRIAEQVVQKSLLKAPKDPTRRKSVEDKIRGQIETEERFKHIQDFMKIWNRFREMYLDCDPIQPKNKGQITAIENAIEFCEKNKFQLNIMVACVHKAYQKRHVRPAYTAITAYGEEYYEQHYEAVMRDLDREEYEHSAAYKRRED